MIPEWLTDGWYDILKSITNMTLFDIVDIIFVSVLLYYLYVFVRDRRAGKLAMGVALVFLIQLLAYIFDMYVMQFLLQNIFQVGLILLAVLFQPELRAMLEKMGGQSLKGLKVIGESGDNTLSMIGEVADAVLDLSRERTGALLVFERGTKLGEQVMTGTLINADPAASLIKNIFYDKAPLHDGALIIRKNRLHAAGCLLPLSVNPDIIKDLGTRHRAGIGMSENSDAVVVIVSEETGIISVAHEGKLTREFTKETLTETLREYLMPENEKTTSVAKQTLSKLRIPGYNKTETGGNTGEDENE